MSKIKIFISKREDGDVKFNEENRKKIADKLSIPRENFEYIESEHGDKIYEVGKQKPNFYDGIITDKINTPICAYAGDCLAIFFYDERKNIIGITHAGRVGTEKKIAQKMVKKFLEKGANLEDIKIKFSPNISQKNYEVSLVCGEKFHEESKKIISNKKCLLNISLENFLLLVELGIPKKNISKNEIDTFCDKNYFSHRRGDEERFGNFIWIEK